MASEKGSATVPVALFGVSPNSWCGRFHSPFGASGRVLPARRRDADGSGRDDRAPHFQLHGSGLVRGCLRPGGKSGCIQFFPTMIALEEKAPQRSTRNPPPTENVVVV